MQEEEAPAQKQCYYKTMGVELTATDEEIKRAFKKLSLKYHPDKNRKDPETAKKAFQEITEAYNCISDPKERIWYDNNREKLLMNKKDMTKEELELQSYGFDIFALFESDAFEGFGDGKDEFFSVMGKAFTTLDIEEKRTYKFQTKKDDYVDLPEFGNSQTPIEDVVKFYESWQNFSTIKQFAWADEHDTREGENRWEKRSMESDNEKLRRKEKKKYIQTVKDLVALCKKKDPRRAQLIELERQEQERIIAARENNKSEKQKKKEQQEREKAERLKKKEEEQHKAWLAAEEKRLKLLEEKKKQEAQQQTQKVSEKPKEKKEKVAFDQKLYDELNELVKKGETLTKKQQKDLKRFQLHLKSEADRIKQQKKQEQKKTQESQQQQESEQTQEEETAEQADGQAKKRKRNKKKKAAQTEEKPVEEKKEWQPWVADEEQNKEQEQEEEEVQQEQQEQADSWEEATGSKKAKQKIQKEMKKIQKSNQNQDKRSNETKNIDGNFYASVDENNLKKFDRHQKSHLNQKQKQMEEEWNKL